MTRPPVAEVDGLSRSFSGAVIVHALRDVSLRINGGEMVAVVGPSGSGKSTLLNMLGLLDLPTSGEYLIDGVSTGSLSEREMTALRAVKLGFVFQSFHLVGHFTCVQNVMLPLVHQGYPRRERVSLAVAALVRVGLEHRLQARPGTLSGGERQRVAVARAVVHSPSLLLCDEPTGNLDSANAVRTMALLREQVAEDRAVVVVTHDRAVSESADRTVRVLDGRIV